MKKVIFLLLDGARKDSLENHINNGLMPNLKGVIDNGGTLTTAVTVFPSTTGPAYLPFLMGLFPGNCNMPGIRWFDKLKFSRNMSSFYSHRSYVGIEGLFFNKDIKKSQLTIFNIINKSRSIFNEITKGLLVKYDLTNISKIFHKFKSHFYGSHHIDNIASDKLLNSLESDAEFFFCCFLGVDSNSHISGCDSSTVVDSYVNFDNKLGLVIEKLRDTKQLEETLLIITSDHGHSNTHTHLDLVEFLEKHGYKVFSYPLIHKKYLTDIDAAVMVSGNSMSHIYLRKDKNWAEKYTFPSSEKLIDELLKLDAVDIVMTKNEKNQIVIKSTRGVAILENKDSGLEYTPLLNDPFGYKDIRDFLTFEDSLDKTFDTQYPDALVQIFQIFNSPRCGDIVISAETGFDLRNKFEFPEHKSSHGSLKSDHMHVPLIVNKRIANNRIRTVDLFPTIIDFLGFNCPNKVDGKKLDIN